MAENPAKAVVLLSGGLDSPTVVAMAIDQDFEVYALSFSYGQRHTTELDAAKVIAAQFGLNRHVIVDIDLRRFGGFALTDDIEVPKGRDMEQMAGEIPVTPWGWIMVRLQAVMIRWIVVRHVQNLTPVCYVPEFLKRPV